MTIKIFRGKHGTKHDLGKDHPESPDRLFAIDDQLLSSGLDMVCEHADATPIAEAYLKLAHDPYYVKSVFEHAAQSIFCLLYTSPSPRDGLLSRMPSSA